MRYSQKVLDMLEKAVSGEITDFWNFSFDFNSLFGEDEEFAEGWYAENPEMFDYLNDVKLMLFLEEHDETDVEGYIKFLKPYYEKAKELAELNR